MPQNTTPASTAHQKTISQNASAQDAGPQSTAQGATRDQKITTFLWFDDQAEAALELYTATFDNSRVLATTHYSEGAPRPAGTLMSATIELAGQQFILLNGGPHEPFNDAISLFVTCADQAEIDRYWNAFISHGGTPTQCGWLKDPFGVSWQIVPDVLMRYLNDPDPVKAQRVTSAMLQMVKLDVAGLTAAYEGS